MITIKNKVALQKMETAGRLLGEVFAQVAPHVKTGISTFELDQIIERELSARDLVSKSKGYKGYQHVSCISLNDEVVHGVPEADKIIQEGDLVKIDVCASWKGYCADMARCFFVGSVDSKIKELVAVAKCALDKGIEQARVGNRLGDISAAIQQEVERHGFGVVRDFAGHGIGKAMHEAPEVQNVGKFGAGPVLRHGMTLAIEPMITMGAYHVYVAQDGWTAKTKDKSVAAHVEDTVAITDEGAKILTRSFEQEGA